MGWLPGSRGCQLSCIPPAIHNLYSILGNKMGIFQPKATDVNRKLSQFSSKSIQDRPMGEIKELGERWKLDHEHLIDFSTK